MRVTVHKTYTHRDLCGNFLFCCYNANENVRRKYPFDFCHFLQLWAEFCIVISENKTKRQRIN